MSGRLLDRPGAGWVLLGEIVRDDRRTRNAVRLLRWVVPAFLLVVGLVAAVAVVSPVGAGVLVTALGGGAVVRKKVGGRGGSAPT
ncbi:hypothetical protein [Umezawaea tangerina]|uniref:Uncharacterized protein n=1 Tax=Umezawaea tangerina TaxID=84725 RepID=A0A2T0TM17_9PSEU|nr:hypothetical protein [Umezawaea tangerina]PRY46764.1 hypothetical protein CLV43_1011045 [Umezawaea tangerina]